MFFVNRTEGRNCSKQGDKKHHHVSTAANNRADVNGSEKHSDTLPPY